MVLKQYENPKMEIIGFKAADIVTTSGAGEGTTTTTTDAPGFGWEEEEEEPW